MALHFRYLLFFFSRTVEDHNKQLNVSVLFQLKKILEFKEKDQMLKTFYLKKYVSITVSLWGGENLKLDDGQHATIGFFSISTG